MGFNLMDPKEGTRGCVRDGMPLGPISFILMQFSAKFL